MGCPHYYEWDECPTCRPGGERDLKPPTEKKAPGGPIRPSAVVAHKTATIPQEVFAAFNDCIARTWDGRAAVVKQNEVVERVVSALNITRTEVFDRHLLDVEESYRAQGWDVEYDKPGYNETYEATFRFTTGKRDR